jgi:hypothetical protein
MAPHRLPDIWSAKGRDALRPVPFAAHDAAKHKERTA